MNEDKKKKSVRIAALFGVILLVALYLITLIFAIFDFDGKGQLFRACLFATIGVPILIWIYIWLYGVITGKKTMSTVDFLNASGESIAAGEAGEAGTTDESADAVTIEEADEADTTDNTNE